MIRIERHEDVVRFAMSTRRSRLAGMSASAYLVGGVLIDCGFPDVAHEVDRLLQQETLRGVIVTHAHEDHAGNVEAVARRGIALLAHPDTLAYARAPARLPMYRRFTWGEPSPLRSAIVSFEPEGLVLLHTPGHSPDHHVVWDASTRTLFSSDLFIGVKVRVAHHSERPRELVASLRRVLALDPARVFDAHRGLLPTPQESLRAKLAWTEELIGRVEALADTGMPVERIARAVLGTRDANDFVSIGEYSRINLVRAVLAEAGARVPASDGH
ncbi:MAG: MBL fold metallo-hydrolase [Gemmatimonadaceae bacterium]|nr:MBL fold metallo-hydrolase [Gemmatimonadaceae bacterium]